MRQRELSQTELLEIFELDPEVIDIEKDENGRNFPVVRAYDDEGVHFHFWCIHCRTWHVHGRGGRERPYEEGRGGMAGHRSAHCTASNSPFKANGVVLHVVGKFNETIKKKYRKGTSLYCPMCQNQYSAALNACSCLSRFVNKKRKPEHPVLAGTYQKFMSEK